MKNIIHIYGASGSGTSTLGRKISEELEYKFMDTDDYFWLPTNPQYTTKRSKEERLALMKKDISENDNVVISGSLVDWGDELIPLFTLAIRLVTDTEIRIEIDGIAYHTDRDGNEWEEEVLVESVQIMRELNHTKEIENLLINEGMYLSEVCVDVENGVYEPIYLELKRIYESALHVIVNGKLCKHTQPVIELNMLPEEYMAYYYDFFDRYNNDQRIKKRYELREEIIYTSQSLVEDMKLIIDKIVRIYEIEEI